MNVQELATLADLGLDVIVFVLNNAQLGLVRQQQQLFYGERYSAAHFDRASENVLPMVPPGASNLEMIERMPEALD
jgi:thiamine pyrophosphate-dependent acetolactate synthase large subunit-like protein